MFNLEKVASVCDKCDGYSENCIRIVECGEFASSSGSEPWEFNCPIGSDIQSMDICVICLMKIIDGFEV